MPARIGSQKISTFDLPPSDHTYGKVSAADAESGCVIMSSWKEHVPNQQAEPGKDYVALNRDAAKEGATNPKDFARYQKTHGEELGYRQKAGRPEKEAFHVPSDDNPEHAYGDPSRPGTPIDFVINNSYQRSWVQDQKDTFDQATAANGGPKARKPIKQNRSTELRDKAVTEVLAFNEDESKWTMRKFKGVSSRVYN